MGDIKKQLVDIKTSGLTRSFTFVVTESCNLACKYCYQIKKNNKSAMSFEVAKKAVDFVLDRYGDEESSMTFDFIGGEPFLEVDLIDKVCDYIKLELYRRNYKWFNDYSFSITTNGTLYNDPKVQKFISKNKNKLQITISIDGNETKHDMQRVKTDGTGSYKDIIKNVELWIKQFPNANTKVTFASDDLPQLKDSIIHLWNLGIKNVPANVVYENVWKDGDDELLEQQMKSLADYIIDKNISSDYTCGLFDETIALPLTELKKRHNWCSSGHTMLAVNHKGDLYPCLRFMGYSLENKKSYIIGNLDEGINEDLLRPFVSLDISSQSKDECLSCEVAQGCGWCQGFNYDSAESDTIYQRAINLCKMHKARCRANDYYYARLKNELGYTLKKIGIQRDQFIFMLLSNKAVAFCNYDNNYNNYCKMSFSDFKKGIEYAKKNFLVPVIVHDDEKLSDEFKNELRFIESKHIIPYYHKDHYDNQIVVYDGDVDNISAGDNSVLVIDNKNICNMHKIVNSMFEKYSRINIILNKQLETDEDFLKKYEEELEKVSCMIFNYHEKGLVKQFNVLTDTLSVKKMLNCNAGIKSITLAPNGQVYICPAFYYNDINSAIGNFDDGIKIANKQLLSLEKAPICANCDTYHCKRCVFDNKYRTREFNIPTGIQCKISHIERKISKKLQEKVLETGIKTPLAINVLKDIDYSDPYEIIVKQKLIR